MDSKSAVGAAWGCSIATTGEVVLEPHAKRHCSAAGVASTRLASEDTILSLDDCSASECTLFGTPEDTESGGSPAGSVCDEEARLTTSIRFRCRPSCRTPPRHLNRFLFCISSIFHLQRRCGVGMKPSTLVVRVQLVHTVLPQGRNELTGSRLAQPCLELAAMQILLKSYRRCLSNRSPWSNVFLCLLCQSVMPGPPLGACGESTLSARERECCSRA